MTVIDAKAIIERGYTTDAEYDEIYRSQHLSKIMLYDNGKDGESIWIHRLDTQYFVFLNDPLMFWGAPRTICGMVGIANGKVADRTACAKLFQRAGQAAIDYAYRGDNDAA